MACYNGPVYSVPPVMVPAGGEIKMEVHWICLLNWDLIACYDEADDQGSGLNLYFK